MPQKTSPSPWRYFGMGLEYAGAILLMGLIGYYLFDRGEQGTPWGLIVGLLLGFVGATYNLIKTALAANRQANDQSES